MKTKTYVLFCILVLAAMICQIGIGPARAQSLQPQGFIQATGLPLDFQYARTFGVSGVPYQTDNNHLYDLNAVVVNPGYAPANLDQVYALENMGQRVLGYDSSGGFNWAYGDPGSYTTELNNPTAGVVDPNGNLWVTSWERFNIFDADGTWLFRVPEDPWSIPWEDPTRLDCMQGMDLYFPPASTTGLLAVSASCGQNYLRIFSVDISTTPYTYAFETEVSGMFQNPAHLVWNGPDEIFLNDNNGPPAVYRCTRNLDDSFTCNIFDGGEWGQGEHQLQSAQGIALDGAGHLFIADSYNSRVKRCDIAAGTCEENFIGDLLLNHPSDIAFFSNGNILVSDRFDATIRVFDSSGAPVGDPNVFAGTPGSSYIVDDLHYNQPVGIYVDASFNTYLVETAGHRLVKLDQYGTPVWTFGESGISGWDNNHLNWPEGSPAVDSQGRVYVPDRNNQRVVILKADGTYLGQIRGNNPDDPDWLDAPIGVLIDANGDIYVLDNNRSIIKVFDSDRFYKYTIGQESESWPPPQDNEHFRSPRAMALDGLNTLYVADTDNNRVQKCTRPDAASETWTCARFAGNEFQGGSWPVQYPSGVAVDAQHNVYISDSSYHHVFFYTAEGRLISRIGANWGSGEYEFKNPSNIVFDPQGALYVADRDNHRIQKFIPEIETIETVSQIGGSSKAVALLNGDTALVGKGAALQVVDISVDPPVEIAITQPTTDNILDIAVYQNTAYALSEYNGLYIYDVSDPTMPVFQTLFTLQASDNATDIDIFNGIAYIADGGGGLLIYDLANPLNPRRIGQHWSHSGVYSVELVQQGANLVAFVLARDFPDNQPADGWVVALDVTDPANIFEIGSFDTPGSGEWFSLSGTTLVVADGMDNTNTPVGVQLVNVTDPAAMLIAGALEDFYTFKVEAAGNMAYAIDGDVLYAIDISNPAVPVLVASSGASENDLSNLTLAGDRVLVTDYSAGLRIFDISGLPALPELTGLNTGVNNTLWVDLMDQYAVISGWDGGLQVLDVSDRQHPIPVGSMLTTQSVPNTLTVEGSYAYLANFDLGMTVVDLTDPTAPVEVGYYDSEFNNTTHLDVTGDYAYLADGDALRVVDISDPTAPVLAGEYFPTDGRSVWHVIVAPSTDPDITTPVAYLIEQGTDTVGPLLRMIDISDPTSPVAYPEFADLQDGFPTGLAVLGQYVYISYNDGFRRLEIFDAVDISAPFEVGELPSPGQSFRNVTVQEMDGQVYAYIAAKQSLFIYNVTDPGSINFAAELVGVGWARNIAVNGPFVFTTFVDGGLITSWFAPTTQSDVLSAGGGFQTQFDHVNFTFGADILPVDSYFIHTPVYDGNVPPAGDANLIPVHLAFDVRARDAATDQFVTPTGPYNMVIPYDESRLNGAREGTLKLFWWDPAMSSWVEEPAVVDTTANTITASPNHFSIWRVFGTGLNFVYLPVIIR